MSTLVAQAQASAQMALTSASPSALAAVVLLFARPSKILALAAGQRMAGSFGTSVPMKGDLPIAAHLAVFVLTKVRRLVCGQSATTDQKQIDLLVADRPETAFLTAARCLVVDRSVTSGPTKADRPASVSSMAARSAVGHSAMFDLPMADHLAADWLAKFDPAADHLATFGQKKTGRSAADHLMASGQDHQRKAAPGVVGPEVRSGLEATAF
jgi:hypothetical protein